MANNQNKKNNGKKTTSYDMPDDEVIEAIKTDWSLGEDGKIGGVVGRQIGQFIELTAKVEKFTPEGMNPYYGIVYPNDNTRGLSIKSLMRTAMDEKFVAEGQKNDENVLAFSEDTTIEDAIAAILERVSDNGGLTVVARRKNRFNGFDYLYA